MTGLLVSVRDATEARLALAGGADLIDVKEPARGSLGRADAAIWREVLDEVAGQRPVSAALGELLHDPIAELSAQCVGLRFVKVGLAGCAAINDWSHRLQTALAELPNGVGRVAVAYADHQQANSPAPLAILRATVQLRCEALLIDTYDKSQGDLFVHLSLRRLREVVRLAREFRVQVVLAGSLTPRKFPRLLRLSPDFVAVRGAACHGSRESSIQRERVVELRAALTVTAGTNSRRKVKTPT